MDNFKVIGISGVAGSGKDQFYRLLEAKLKKAHINSSRYAIADRLKEELRNFIGWYYEFDLVTCSPEQKEDMRPLMVFHGAYMRKITKGKYWTDFLKKQIERENPEGIVCITDIRFNEFENDEVEWLKGELGGTLVHVSRYKRLKLTEAIKQIKGPDVGEIKSYTQPANDFESINDPKLKERADYLLEWETVFGSLGEIDEQLSHHVDSFWDWYTARP